MSKTLLYRWFGLGAVPPDARERIAREGVVIEDEGLSATITFRRYRAPGRYYGWRRAWFSGSIVLTREHLLVFRFRTPVIGLAWNHEAIDDLHASLPGPNAIAIALEASRFEPHTSGNIEVRLRTPKAASILDEIRTRVAGGLAPAS